MKINGKPARLAFDTGAEGLCLWHKSAQRLGLKFTPPPTNELLPLGRASFGETEECTVTWGPTSHKDRFFVIDMPDYLHPDFDGVLSWSCLVSNIVQIDASNHKMTFPSELPKKVATWTKLPLQTNSYILQFILFQNDNINEILVVDTGDTAGIGLPPDDWRVWKSSHAKQPLTLSTFFIPRSGQMVEEEAWAKQLVLGPLILANVPVTEATPTHIAMATGTDQFKAVLGFAALKRMDLIVDGAHGMAYLKLKTTRPPAYEHNRSGVVFVPPDPQSDTLLAHVVAGSPAYEAGICDGDALLRVDKRDISHWRTDPHTLVNRVFRERPAGTKIILTLKRGGETIEATVILRDIVAPEKTKQ